MSSNNEMCVPESAPTITTNSNSLIVYLIALGAFALGTIIDLVIQLFIEFIGLCIEVLEKSLKYA